MDLFDRAAAEDPTGKPLAERMRPRTLEEFVGQEHLLGPGTALRRAIEADQVPSLILWGPPGTRQDHPGPDHGQAHRGRVRALQRGARRREGDPRDRRGRARPPPHAPASGTILFVDEIHRFNKAQQDAFLPHVEDGTITLIGATTENPSFEVNAALLSRCRVITLRALDRGGAAPRCSTGPLAAGEGLAGAVGLVDGRPARRIAAARRRATRARRSTRWRWPPPRRGVGGRATIERAGREEALQRSTVVYDKAGEEHYNVVSAFIKSLRGSDPDAAVYWLARMLEAGEDPLLRAAPDGDLRHRGRRERRSAGAAGGGGRAPGGRARRPARGRAPHDPGRRLPGARAQVEHRHHRLRRGAQAGARARAAAGAAASCATRRPS